MRLPLILGLVFMLAGCADPAPPQMDRLISELDGQFSGHSFPPMQQQVHGLLLTNQSQWDSFWSIHRPDGQAQPEVDFKTRFVAVLFLGDRPSMGYQIAVTGLLYEDSEYVLTYSVGEPGAGCEVPATPSQPNDIVAIDRVHGSGHPALRTELDRHIVTPCS